MKPWFPPCLWAAHSLDQSPTNDLVQPNNFNKFHVACYYCDSHTNVQNKQYKWHVVSENTLNTEPHLVYFNIVLCNECINVTTRCKNLVGYDWYDAFNNLCNNYLNKQQCKNKAKKDAATAQSLGLSIRQLKKMKQDSLEQIKKIQNTKY